MLSNVFDFPLYQAKNIKPTCFIGITTIRIRHIVDAIFMFIITL